MKKLLQKTMFILLGLIAGVNGAWAEGDVTTTTYDFEDDNVLFTNDSRISSAIVTGDVFGNNSLVLSSKAVMFTDAHNAQNGYAFAHLDLSSLVDKAANVKISFDTWINNGARSIITIGDASVRGNTGESGKNTYNSTGAIFSIGANRDYDLMSGTTSRKGTFTNKWVNVTVDVNVKENKYSYSVVNIADETVIKSGADVAYYATNADACSQIDIFGWINNEVAAVIDNIKIEVTTDVVPYADYTVMYVSSIGTEIATASTYNDAVGSDITLKASDTEAIYFEEKKYVYVSDDSEGKTVAEDGSTIVTVTFREASKWSYTAKSNVGTFNVTGEVWEGDAVSVAYPRYILVGNQLYKKNANSNDYHQLFTPTADNHIETLTYVADLENIVYYREAEEIEGMTSSSSSNANIRCSNAFGAYNKGPEIVSVTTLPAGVYKIYTAVWGSKDTNLLFNLGDVEWGAMTTGSWTSRETEFTLYADGTISLPASGSSSRVIDYIVIQKIGDAPTNYTATVSDLGLATFCSPANLDFSTATSIAAYKASVDTENNKVTLTKVTTVAAGEGVLLKSVAGGAATEEIKVIESVEKNEGNAFVGTLVDVIIPQNGGANTNYVLSKVGDVIGFYLAKADGTTTVTEGKAYLPVPTTTSASNVFSISWGDDEGTTGINNIDANVKADNAYYTLQGVRVAAPTKGLYIVNGKKVVVK